ncbi:unnamed protein product [Owenia fusiformis]|uniref:Uncharacterized protein n=1 Tax=Owenia fusiformis TaxID=6347 RepID=A0A8S4NAB0_OWEFU|nr:unnamed protein product [Owenia fusiformis]
MDEIVYLLMSLNQDAELILLFMKTLNTITVSIIGNVNDQTLLNVSLTIDARNDLNFLESIKSRQLLLDNPDVATYDPVTMLSLVRVKVETLGETVKHKTWLVCHLYEMSVRLRNLIRNEKVGLIPLVGCAMDVSENYGNCFLV